MTVSQTFSASIERSPWIQNDVPHSARIALLHLLNDLIEKGYTGGWFDMDREIRRIARQLPANYPTDIYSLDDAEQSAEISVRSTILNDLTWNKIFDFCERLYSYLAKESINWDASDNYSKVIISREKVHNYISEEIQRIFLEEKLSYIFDEGKVKRRFYEHTKCQISKAEEKLRDSRLDDANTHYNKAIDFFLDPYKPDFENAIKEAVCAVEAAAIKLFPNIKENNLGKIMHRLTGRQPGQIPPPLPNTISCLNDYRGSGKGVAHPALTGGQTTRTIAEYVISITASQIIFLYELAYEDKEKPPV